ncbi:MAG: hypothetical protein JWO20_3261 [Candidatus Angelobacter sp.]|jgi:hypothetical protein|nr:hypothetical protein [Candidatus Angelobacter sp.]
MSAMHNPVVYVNENALSETELINCLLELTLNPYPTAATLKAIGSLSNLQRNEFLRLANMHHVIIRALDPVRQAATANGNTGLSNWASEGISKEEARVQNALAHLHAVCTELESAGCPITVMKSLDHYPDLGSDLDLYTVANASRVIAVMQEKFNAKILDRSWGDHIAQKWNFSIPGLPEPIEIHVQRLGQMGEHRALARRFNSRRVTKSVQGKDFFVPAPEERIIVATLQRMYRHFYFRVCDVVNSTAIVDSGALDVVELKRATGHVGIWPGIASYLCVVSDLAKRHRGYGLRLPALVTEAAVCGGDQLRVRNSFLRVPILSCGANLYSGQITRASFNGDVAGTLRLGLLPYLAVAAAVSYKITGSDKGIW